MIKWSPDKGWYDTNTGLALNSPEEEKRQKEYLEDRNKFLEENMYDPEKRLQRRLWQAVWLLCR